MSMHVQTLLGPLLSLPVEEVLGANVPFLEVEPSFVSECREYRTSVLPDSII